MTVLPAAVHGCAYLSFSTANVCADVAPCGRASGKTGPFDAHMRAQKVTCQGLTVHGEFTPREGGTMAGGS